MKGVMYSLCTVSLAEDFSLVPEYFPVIQLTTFLLIWK